MKVLTRDQLVDLLRRDYDFELSQYISILDIDTNDLDNDLNYYLRTYMYDDCIGWDTLYSELNKYTDYVDCMLINSSYTNLVELLNDAYNDFIYDEVVNNSCICDYYMACSILYYYDHVSKFSEADYNKIVDNVDFTCNELDSLVESIKDVLNS